MPTLLFSILTLWSSFTQIYLPKDVVVGCILIEGNKKTQSYIILREIDIKTGDTLVQATISERLEKNRRKVFNLNLFITSNVELLSTENPLIFDLKITVKEQWYIFPFPVFQLADRNFNEWWTEKNGDLKRTTLGLALRHKNVRGRAEELKINLEFGFTNFYEFFYKIPYLDKAKKNGITYGISYSTNKNLRFNTSEDKLLDVQSESTLRNRFYTNIILRRRNRYYDFQFLELRYNINRIADTVAKLNPTYFLTNQTKQQYLQLSYTYLYDFRDKAQYPLRGYLFGIQANKSGILPSDNINVFDLSLSYTSYKSISKKWFSSAQFKVRTSTPSLQPFLQTRGLGYGADFVRGYELYVIDGQHTGYLKTSIKFQALDKVLDLRRHLKISQFNTFPLAIYSSVFFDLGYVSNQHTELNNSHLANTLLLGYGLGLDIVGWYNGVFRLNYVWNRERQTGLRLSLGREF